MYLLDRYSKPSLGGIICFQCLHYCDNLSKNRLKKKMRIENQLHWVKKCVFLPLKYFYFEVNIVHLIGKKYQESIYTSHFTLTMNATHIRIPVLRIPYYYYYYSQKCPSHSNGLLPLHKKVYRKKPYTIWI